MRKVSVLVLGALLVGFGGGGSGSNGGGGDAAIFASIMDNVLDVLGSLDANKKRALDLDLEALRRELQNGEDPVAIVVLPNVEVDGEPRDARNFYPAERKIEYAEAVMTAPAEKRLRVVIHENLSIVGKEVSDDYHLTTSVVKLLREEGFDMDLLAETAAFEANRQGIQTDLLFSDSFKDQDGMLLADAQDLCARLQQRYEKEYGFVYCSFPMKRSLLSKTETQFREEYRHMGFRSGTTDTTTGRKVLFGVYRSYPRKRTTREPVLKTVEIPYDHTSVEDHRIYGIRVYGVGRIDPDTEGVVLMDSRHQKALPTYEEALLECRRAKLRYGSEEPQFRLSKCRVIPSEEDGFHWEIWTNDPLVAG